MKIDAVVIVGSELTDAELSARAKERDRLALAIVRAVYEKPAWWRPIARMQWRRRMRLQDAEGARLRRHREMISIARAQPREAWRLATKWPPVCCGGTLPFAVEPFPDVDANACMGCGTVWLRT